MNPAVFCRRAVSICTVETSGLLVGDEILPPSPLDDVRLEETCSYHIEAVVESNGWWLVTVRGLTHAVKADRLWLVSRPGVLNV